MNKLPDTNIQKILQILALTYPDAHCELNYSNPFELLVATILSAQTTDKKVNETTPYLFPEYHCAFLFSQIPLLELENKIRKLGLYKVKAKNLIETSKIIANQYNGKVPCTMEELIKLPGVGRKTASVVLINAFHIPAFPVDTHVTRVSNRLGLVCDKKPDKIEKQLTLIIPKELWSITHHQLIWHGRRLCKAKKPECSNCPLAEYCPTWAHDYGYV